MMAKVDLAFWMNFLNDRAEELGLERAVKAITPREGEMMAISWAFETGDGILVDLGWSVESAEAALRELAGQS